MPTRLRYRAPFGLHERLRETQPIDPWSKIAGDFIAVHPTPVALREAILYVRVLQPALHYELEQISKLKILRTKTTLRQQNHSRRAVFGLGSLGSL